MCMAGGMLVGSSLRSNHNLLPVQGEPGIAQTPVAMSLAAGRTPSCGSTPCSNALDAAVAGRHVSSRTPSFPSTFTTKGY